MKRYFLTSFLFCHSLLILCQNKGDYIWLGGYQTNFEGNGKLGFSLDFNNKPMTPTVEFPLYGIDNHNGLVCDTAGKLLFYSNGRGIFNNLDQLMPNGNDINNGEWASKFWPDPSTGYPGRQDVLILKDPSAVTGYFILHKTPVFYPIGYDSIEIRVSYVDMTLENGLGDVVYKNQYFYKTQNLLLAYLTGVQHKNKRDWWVLQPTNSNKIKTFLLDPTGIHVLPDQEANHSFTTEKSSSSGTAKFSPDGKHYAIYNETDHLLIYDFDRETGKLHFKKELVPIDTSGSGIFCSVEWSPNSRFIYTATEIYLHQIDTWEVDPDKAITHIDTYNGTLDPFQSRFDLLAQAPDCKIYVTPGSSSNSLHVINKPNELGKACDFVQNGIKLPYPNGGGFPNFPRFRVDEVDKCDPTISSIFGEMVYYRRDLHVYPNPSSGIYYITPPEHLHTSTLVVTDIHGIIHHQMEVDPDQWPDYIDISDLPAGSYNIEIYPLDNKARIFYGRQVVKI
jgi:hypothetical protein